MSVNEKSIANLRPVTSTEEARERGKKGGQKSGEVRRQRKKFKETLELLLHLPPGLSDQKETLLALGVDEDDCDNQTLIAISMIQSAAAGDVKAAAWVRDTVGEKPTDKVDAVIAHLTRNWPN